MKNDELDMFEKLAAEARRESTLPVSVAGRVLDALRAAVEGYLGAQRQRQYAG